MARTLGTVSVGIGFREAALAASLCTLLASGAQAQAARYVGPHPVDLEGHWHTGDSHTHDGLGVGPGPFVEVGDARVFLGDPVSFGYGGTVFTYRGAHPLPFGLDAYCSLRGEHAHPFAPEGSYRHERDGVYAYIGALRGGRPMLRPRVMAPDSPVIRPGLAPTNPFWFAGCLQQRGALGAVQPLFGCRPLRPFPNNGFASRRRNALPARPVRTFNGPGFSVPQGRTPQARRRGQ